MIAPSRTMKKLAIEFSATLPLRSSISDIAPCAAASSSASVWFILPVILARASMLSGGTRRVAVTASATPWR